MTLMLGAVLLCAFGLDRLLSPAGNAVLRAMDSRSVAIDGSIEAQTPGGRLVFEAGGVTYALARTSQARPYVGRTVRITGTVHQTTGVLDIRTIAPVLTKAAQPHSM